ncbi:hypothetical protein ElyMa_005268500 [Elysia marginata]|uniref:Uncharacterized protein n=1 Tax=Elysia marginata TaxID=1093978 RepID=A0AAV4JYR5_9GAST|nr:hypothetical protein ElyMa_005268500 [Elysia marginata]
MGGYHLDTSVQKRSVCWNQSRGKTLANCHTTDFKQQRTKHALIQRTILCYCAVRNLESSAEKYEKVANKCLRRLHTLREPGMARTLMKYLEANQAKDPLPDEIGKQSTTFSKTALSTPTKEENSNQKTPTLSKSCGETKTTSS